MGTVRHNSMSMPGANEPGGGVRYNLRRTRWDMAMCGAMLVSLLVVGASVGQFEFFLAMASAAFVILLSEPTSRLLSYVILHRDHIDISQKPWFAKTAADKWTIPYDEIETVKVNDQKAEITIAFRGEGPWRTRWRLKSTKVKERSVTFRLGSLADAREVAEKIEAARSLASELGLSSTR